MTKPSTRPCGEYIRAGDASDVLVVGNLAGRYTLLERAVRWADLAGRPKRHLILQAAMGRGGTANCRTLGTIAELRATWGKRVHFLPGRIDTAFATDYPCHDRDRRLVNEQWKVELLRDYGDCWRSEFDRLRRFVLDAPLAYSVFENVIVCSTPPDHRWVDEYGRLFDLSMTDDDFAEPRLAFAFVWGGGYDRRDALRFREASGAKLLVHGAMLRCPVHRDGDDRIMLGNEDSRIGCALIHPTSLNADTCETFAL
ncbi:MAG TPA: hypothetical protein VGE52_05000 [Pirellulales bacterium]